MPGFGLGMRLVMRQEQRLEQRLELRLEQCIRIALLEDLDTEGGADVEHELEILRKIAHDLDRGIYSDVANFHERVGKRVKKDERTEGTKLAVESLRAIIDVMNPPLEFVRAMVGAAISVAEKHAAPSEELRDLSKVLAANCVTTDPAVRLVVYRMWEAACLNEGGYVNLLPLIKRVVFHVKTDQAAFRAFIEELTEVCTNGTLVDAMDRWAQDILPHQPTPHHVREGFRLINGFETLLGHSQHIFPRALFRSYLENNETAPNEEIPTVLLPILVNQTDELQQKLISFFTDEYLTRSRDNQRHVLETHLRFLEKRNQAMFNRTVAIVSNAREFVKLCAEIKKSMRFGSTNLIPESVTCFDEAVVAIRESGRSTAFAKLPFREGYRDKIFREWNRIDPKLIEVIATLAGIYSSSHPDGLPLLARILEEAADGTFLNWRYGHELADKQLTPVKASRAWTSNYYSKRILGRQDRVKDAIEAMRPLAAEAATAFEAECKYEWTAQTVDQIQAEIIRIDNDFRNPGIKPEAKKLMGPEKRDLLVRFRLANIVQILHELGPHSIVEDLRFLKESLLYPKLGSLLEPVATVIAILDAPDVEAGRMLVVRESDAPRDTLTVGADPVRSCQRWYEYTAHNACLLAYTVDSHKKVWFFSDRHGSVIGRAVMRMFPFKKSALLMLERPYTTSWSQDHSKAFVMAVLEKAGEISREIGKPVYVGYTGWERDHAYGETFKWLAEQLNGHLQTSTVPLKLLPSLNKIEYADSCGGHLTSGTKTHAVRLHYLTIDTAAEDEAAKEDLDY
ncbi:hypothetical protein KJ910_03375 [Patescibacteria group bacterium]|nr:hypothetical protein [Patescibacteria group bacterium]MBU1906671.1 hypothetical protein [Patescibacteria group bacterium]